MGNTLRLVSWNVNGIRAVVKKGFYDLVKDFHADILCLQETKAQPETMPPLADELPDYDLVINSAEQKGYSGTAVLYRIKPLNHVLDTGAEEHSKEGRVITLDFDRFYLVNAYVPNSGQELKRLDYRKEWDIHLAGYLKSLDAKKPVIFTGDLNVAHEPIDLARPDPNYDKTAGYTQVEIDGFNNLVEMGLVDTFRQVHPHDVKYSFWNMRFRAREKNLGWRIDYFLVSRRIAGQVKDAFIWDHIQGSDHCPVGLDIEI